MRAPWRGSGLLAAILGGLTVAWPASKVEAAEVTVLVADERLDRIVAATGPDSLDTLWVLYDDSSEGPDLSRPVDLLNHPSRRDVLVLDGGTLDAVLSLEDRNGDGDAQDPGECRVLFDGSGEDGVRLTTPNTLAWDAAGALLIADDGRGSRQITRHVDLTADGDYLDAGESRVVYSAFTAAEPLVDAPTALAWHPEGYLLVGDSTRGEVFRMTDLDEDGAYLSLGEVRLYMEGMDPELAPDVGALAAAPDGSVWTLNEDLRLLLVAEDVDEDGVALSAGEVAVFASLDGDPNDMWLVDERSLLVADGEKDSVALVADGDGDGAALDPEEIVQLTAAPEFFSVPTAVTLDLRSSDPPAEARFTRGDANGDGGVDISDAVAILGYLFLGDRHGSCDDALDGDDSGTINITDAVYLLQFLFSGGSSPPLPFPASGEDPTEDGIGCDTAA